MTGLDLQAGTPADAGARAALDRLDRYDIRPTDDTVRDAVTKAMRALQGERAEDRFVELFTESVVVAAAARATYQEPQLSDDDIARHLEQAKAFFNSYVFSWFHQFS
jgi:hypothetical protein